MEHLLRHNFLSFVKGKDCINEETLGDHLSDQTVGMGHDCSMWN
jgi:hypothetical protein